MPRRISIDGVVYWGTFLFAAVVMTYLLVTLIRLSSEEATAFLASGNYREQIRYAVVETSTGSFKIVFMRSQAPGATKKFLRLAQSGFYDQTKFYSFPKGVFVESDFARTSSETEGGNVNHVFDENVKDVGMTRGLVTMPRRKDAKVDGSLIIVFAEDDLLPASKAYVAFARVVEGMDVIDKIAEISPQKNAGESSAPVTLTSVVTD